MNTPITIPDSTRLRYRLMDSRDAPLWFELDQDPEVMRFLNDSKPTTWEQMNDFFVPRVVAFTDPALGLGLWEMADKDSGEYLGWILARRYRFDDPDCKADNIELGWRLKRACWGKGITTEGARAVVDMLQRNPTLRVFSAIADKDNLASIGVMKHLGMRYVDERVHHTPLGNFPVVYYEMPSPRFEQT